MPMKRRGDTLGPLLPLTSTLSSAPVHETVPEAGASVWNIRVVGGEREWVERDGDSAGRQSGQSGARSA